MLKKLRSASYAIFRISMVIGLSAVIIVASSRPAAAATPIQSNIGQAIGSFISHRRGLTSVYVYDVAKDRYFFYNRNAPEYTASIVKVDILMTVMARHQAEYRALTAHEDYLAHRMIEYSDNSAATALWNSVGGSVGVAAYNRAAGGLTATTMGIGSRWGLTVTTAADQVTLIKHLVVGDRILTPASRSYILNLMEHVTPSQHWGISYGVGAGSIVALKNGWLPVHGNQYNWQINSIGYVNGPAHRYIVTVLSAHNPSSSYGIQTVQGVSALAWKYLN